MIHFDGNIPILTPKVDNIVPISILPELDHHTKILSEITQLHEIDVNCLQNIEVRMRFRICQAYLRQHFVYNAMYVLNETGLTFSDR